MSERLLTTEEVAERLRVHPETVKRHLRDGTLEGFKASRRSGWRISEAALEKYYARFGSDAQPPAVITPELEARARAQVKMAEEDLTEIEKLPRTRQVRKLLRHARAQVKEQREIVSVIEEMKAAGIVAEREEFAQIVDKMTKQ